MKFLYQQYKTFITSEPITIAWVYNSLPYKIKLKSVSVIGREAEQEIVADMQLGCHLVAYW